MAGKLYVLALTQVPQGMLQCNAWAQQSRDCFTELCLVLGWEPVLVLTPRPEQSRKAQLSLQDMKVLS